MGEARFKDIKDLVFEKENLAFKLTQMDFSELKKVYETDEYLDFVTFVKSTVRVRTCIRCGNRMLSINAGHRLHPLCRADIAYFSGELSKIWGDCII